MWQSKLVLLLVMPFAAAGLVLETHWWATQQASVAIWSIGLSLLLGAVVLWLHAATPAGALTGAVITASLMFSTVTFPYQPWHTALPPVLAVSLLAWLATKLGRGKKAQLGTAENRRGRSAAQVAANLGVAALVSSEFVQDWLTDSHWFSPAGTLAPVLLFAVMLAALAEAAADTVSSEIGQVLGGRPRMITTLRAADAGTDGAISLPGTFAGVIAAAVVAGIGTLALGGNLALFWISCAGAVFGLFFDSLLGATLERRGWLNNDGVNFLSTASAAGFALVLMAVIQRVGLR
ncbi:MAG TPA: DUF92 domain-containing protein [Terracidiphilus sp.]|nr:DUF92 domain-containing protein [Terracidiphilus sp.]